jgi:hypothetical protein
MTKREQLINEIDLALFRVLRRAHDLNPGTKNDDRSVKARELISAIRYARHLSEDLLPESKRREFERIDVEAGK